MWGSSWGNAKILTQEQLKSEWKMLPLIQSGHWKRHLDCGSRTVDFTETSWCRYERFTRCANCLFYPLTPNAARRKRHCHSLSAISQKAFGIHHENTKTAAGPVWCESKGSTQGPLHHKLKHVAVKGKKARYQPFVSRKCLSCSDTSGSVYQH